MCKDNGRGRVWRAHTPQGQKGETDLDVSHNDLGDDGKAVLQACWIPPCPLQKWRCA